MSKREIVVLVSRAIAILQIITAALDAFLSLPQQAFFLSQQIRLQNAFPGMHAHIISPIAWMTLTLTIARIVILLIIAAIFWNCGPAIQHMLLPETAAE